MSKKKVFRIGRDVALLGVAVLLLDAFFGRYTVPDSIRGASKPLRVQWVPESL